MNPPLKPLFLWLLCFAPLTAAASGIDPSLEYLANPFGDGINLIRWYGESGYSYFVQVADPADPLKTWHFAEVIESGNDQDISHEVDGTADKGFFRLKYTDQVPGPGEDLDTADFDGDGLTNLAEIRYYHTDPLNPDSDGDGLPDGWEVAHNLDPNDSTGVNGASGDPDGDGLTNAQEYQLGTNPTLADTDGDGAPDGVEYARGSDPRSASSVPPCDPVLVWETKMAIGNENTIVGKATSSHTYRQFPADSSDTIYFDNALNLDALLTGLTGYAYSPFSDGSDRIPLVDFAGLPQSYLEDETRDYGPSLNVFAISHDLAYPNGTASNPSRRSKSMGMNLRLENQWNAPEDTTYRFLKVHIKAPMPAPPVGSDETDETFYWNIPAESYVLVQAGTETVEFKIKKGERVSGAIELAPPAIEAGMCHIVGLIAIPVAVDANRDGMITFDAQDTTTAEKPYTFWANDDCDDGHTVDKTYNLDVVLPDGSNELISYDWEEDDLKYVDSNILPDTDTRNKLDCYLTIVPCCRDLEDFSRLWIDFNAVSQILDLSDPSLTLQFRMQSTPTVPGDNPYVKFYQAVEADGGRKYLTDNDTGFNQKSGVYGHWLGEVGPPTEIPSRAWRNLPPDGICHLLFDCGEIPGPASIVFSLTRNGDTVLEMPPVYLDIKRVTDMYETWTVGDVDAAGVDYSKPPPDATANLTTGQNLPPPQTSEEKDYIMFVHGWNMQPWEKTAYANTMFKRLWQQGYKGRFGAFRWPTFWFTTDIPSLDNFNASEQRAWNSAAPLNALITNRSAIFNVNGASKVRLYAHSMGNIVASECLRQFGPTGAPVHTYIASEAAISSHVFDRTAPNFPSSLSSFPPTPGGCPDTYGYYWQAGASDWPTQWQTDGRPSYMNQQYMPTNVIYRNYYSPDDYALTKSRWPLNQELKPAIGYQYAQAVHNNDPWETSRYRKNRYLGLTWTVLNFPEDCYEAFAFAARSWGEATGKSAATGGVFGALRLDVTPLIVYDDKPEAHKYHSGQFRSSIQKRWGYWDTALTNFDLPHNQP